MDQVMRRHFGNVLVFESNWFIGNLWKSCFVRAVPHARIKITANEEDMTRELKNHRENYSLILINGKQDKKFLRMLSKIKNHVRYRDIPICVYTEDESIEPMTRNYLREYTNIFILQTTNPPYGILEKITAIFTSREDSPAAREALFQPVLYFMQEKNYGRALQSLAKVPDASKLIMRKTILKLRCFFEMSSHQEALELLVKLEEYNILSPSILSMGVRIHESLGHTDEAQRLLDTLIHLYPGTSETLLAQVEILKRTGNIEEIKRLLFDHLEDQSLAQDKCFQALVALCLEKKQYDQLIAIGRWSDQRFDRSTGSQITFQVLCLHHDEEQTELAIEILDALHHLYAEEDQWIPLYNMGQMQSALGRYSQAAESLSMSLVANPRSVDIVQALIETLPRARKEKRSMNPLKLKNAIRRRIIYLNRKMDVRLTPTEENAFKIYTIEAPKVQQEAA